MLAQSFDPGHGTFRLSDVFSTTDKQPTLGQPATSGGAVMMTKFAHGNTHNAQHPVATAFHTSPGDQHRASNGGPGSNAPHVQFANQNNNINHTTGMKNTPSADEARAAGAANHGSHVGMYLPGQSEEGHVYLRPEGPTLQRDEFLPPHTHLHPGANPPERMTGVRSYALFSHVHSYAFSHACVRAHPRTHTNM
jgi:hypothetical protein